MATVYALLWHVDIRVPSSHPRSAKAIDSDVQSRRRNAIQIHIHQPLISTIYVAQPIRPIDPTGPDRYHDEKNTIIIIVHSGGDIQIDNSVRQQNATSSQPSPRHITQTISGPTLDDK